MTYRIIDKVEGVIYEYGNSFKFERDLTILIEKYTQKGKSISLKWKKYPYIIDLCIA